MPDINITVTDKRPVCTTGATVVCDNSDYTVHWDLDEEWSAYDTKTMRVIYMDSTYADTVFTGDSVALPPVPVPGCVQIGLYAGDIHTSRMALLRALSSVRSASGAPANPTPDVYDQLMERMAQLENPDWNQNDPTAKDYVKNRTHWVETVYTEMFSDDAATFVDSGYNGRCEYSPDEVTWTLTAGETYKVVYDGVEYMCTCKSRDAYGRTWIWLGNGSFAGPYNEFEQDTGHPFLITATSISTKSAGNHSIQITSIVDEYHKLDPKYLTDVESAMTVKSREILDLGKAGILTKGDTQFVYNNEAIQRISANMRLDNKLDATSHKMFYLGTPVEKTYKDVFGTIALNVKWWSETESQTPLKADGTAVTDDDLPFGGTLLGLTFDNKLVLLNPRPKEPVSLPTVTTSDNGKTLKVVDGAWAVADA